MEAPVVEPEEIDDTEGKISAEVYTIELEGGRHKTTARARSGRENYGDTSKHLHGDAFCVPFKAEPGVGLLYLNPPYEPNKVFGREEERWRRRFSDALVPEGILVFVVPHYALASSAETLALRYEDVSCYSLSAFLGNLYRRVVVFGKKLTAPRFVADPEIFALVNIWVKDGLNCPELPDATKNIADRSTRCRCVMGTR